MNIATWAKQRGLSVIETHPAVIADIEPYISKDERAQATFKFHLDELSNPQSLVLIEKATVRDSIGLVELPDGHICYEGNWYLPYLLDHPVYRRRHLPLDTKFLIHDKPYAYQLDSLRAYGIEQDRLELQPVGIDTKIEKLWFANPIGHSGLGSGSVLNSVARRLNTFFNIYS
ncbi:hypothetical protein VB711_22975, partial [Cronbergia sp. UHCC 0137]|uniref:hypothetical protein n=1 Tax=Cronbergia sp. UHCC 0137 TaxID=3110239 RepID=UPI002B220910